MKFTDTVLERTILFKFSGRIYGGKEATLFYGRLHEYLNLGYKNFIIDCNNVIRMNSCGLGILTSANNTIKKVNGNICLTNIDKIESLLVVTRLATVFDHYDTIEEAILPNSMKVQSRQQDSLLN